MNIIEEINQEQIEKLMMGVSIEPHSGIST